MTIEKRISGPCAEKWTLRALVYRTVLTFVGILTMAAVPVSAIESSPLIAPPQGLAVSGPVESYRPDSLYEKINGQAELYLSAGFEELKSQWYERVDDAGKMIEVNVYHMGSLLNAFSVYSQQKRLDAEKLNITQFAYAIQSAVFMVHGSFYVEILPSESSSPMTQLAKQLAKRFIHTIRVEAVTIKELEYFPAENLNRGSITIIPKDAFGMSRLDNVFMATYTFGSHQLTAYLSDRKSPAAAQQLVNDVRGYFRAFDGRDVTPAVSIEGARLIMVMDSYELIFSIGPYLVGVHEASTRMQAEKLGDMMHQSLQERLKLPDQRKADEQTH